MKQLVCSTINAGLELEYEGVHYTDVHDALLEMDDIYWVADIDHSLRPSDFNTELKFRRPLQGRAIMNALANLSVLDDFDVECSWRCGMHVHIDYTGAQYAEAHNTFILSALLEPVLFEWGGPSRVESKFCGTTSMLAPSFINPGDRLRAMKYSAVNLKSLENFCTVEFRYGDATASRKRMLDYINVNLALRLASAQFDNGWELVESLMRAPSRSAWIEANMEPLAAELLLPAARKHDTSNPWGGLATSAIMLADHQETVPNFFIGR